MIFRPNLRKTIAWLLVSAAFAVGGAWMVRSGQWFGWMAVAFFGLGVIVFTLLLLPNSSYLRIAPDGLTVCSLFRSHSYRWSDVVSFAVRRIATKQMVIVNFSERYRDFPRARRISARLTGAEGTVAVSGSWDVSMEQLAALLNRYREQHGAV